MMAQKSKSNRFVIWSDKIADKPLVFANDIEFIRDTEDQLSLYVDGAAFEGKAYGTKFGDIDKSSPYWAAWISALEGSGSAIQYYKVKGTDDNGQAKDDVVVACRPVSVLGAPSVGKRLAYEEAVFENGENIDEAKVISADGYDKYYGNIIADDDGYNDEYLFRVYRNGQYYYYRSETKPVQFVNFAVKAPAKPKNLVEENISTSWVKETIDAIKSGFGVSATNTTAVTQGKITKDELKALMNTVVSEGKVLYWNHSINDPMQGKAVVALQKLLGNVNVTGIFEQATENAVEQFQKENGLPISGKADINTCSALLGFILLPGTDLKKFNTAVLSKKYDDLWRLGEYLREMVPNNPFPSDELLVGPFKTDESYTGANFLIDFMREISLKSASKEEFVYLLRALLIPNDNLPNFLGWRPIQVVPESIAKHQSHFIATPNSGFNNEYIDSKDKGINIDQGHHLAFYIAMGYYYTESGPLNSFGCWLFDYDNKGDRLLGYLGLRYGRELKENKSINLSQWLNNLNHELCALPGSSKYPELR